MTPSAEVVKRLRRLAREGRTPRSYSLPPARDAEREAAWRRTVEQIHSAIMRARLPERTSGTEEADRG